MAQAEVRTSCDLASVPTQHHKLGQVLCRQPQAADTHLLAHTSCVIPAGARGRQGLSSIDHQVQNLGAKGRVRKVGCERLGAKAWVQKVGLGADTTCVACL